ncbi:hypothetical protein FB451DRAFT_1172055 [Mycena latifolia]|nr:hypothetical protein FB451DRAFT_1172055 [Mycena latifolia]
MTVPKMKRSRLGQLIIDTRPAVALQTQKDVRKQHREWVSKPNVYGLLPSWWGIFFLLAHRSPLRRVRLIPGGETEYARERIEAAVVPPPEWVQIRIFRHKREGLEKQRASERVACPGRHAGRSHTAPTSVAASTTEIRLDSQVAEPSLESTIARRKASTSATELCTQTVCKRRGGGERQAVKRPINGDRRREHVASFPSASRDIHSCIGRKY